MECKPKGLQEALQKAGIPFTGISSENDCSAYRVNLAGNMISTLITPRGITLLERLFRRNPVDGTLNATPDRPFRFELGAIDVPQQTQFVMLDYRFSIHVPSGLAAGDTEELEDRRLATVLGYDIRFTDVRDYNVSYQLEPSDPAPSTSTFAEDSNAGSIPGEGVGGVPQSLFARLRAQQSTGQIASGTSTLPQRHRRDVQPQMPFTYIIEAGKRVNFDVAVFRPIPIPVSFFEVEVSGFFIGSNEIEKFIGGITFCPGGT